MDIGTQILIDRRDAKLTQAEVAKHVHGLSRATLIDIETRKVVPTKATSDAIFLAIKMLRQPK